MNDTLAPNGARVCDPQRFEPPAATTSPPMPRLLLPGEADQLAACEEIIERGLQTFIEVGFALASIRDRRLYRVEFGTWEEYCTARWQMSARRATMLCAASETVRNLGLGDPNRNNCSELGEANRNNCSELALPANESQVRPLVGLPPEEQRAAWAEAVATAPNGRLTARHVEQTVLKRRQALGMAIPANGQAHESQPSPPSHAPADSPTTSDSPVVPLRPKETREARLITKADRAIADLRDLLAECGTPDSEAAAELHQALERVEKFREHQTKLENLQSSRV